MDFYGHYGHYGQDGIIGWDKILFDRGIGEMIMWIVIWRQNYRGSSRG